MSKQLSDDLQRLWDLVRHQRMELFHAELIDPNEYADLAADHVVVARLETYDGLRTKLAAAEQRAEALKNDAGLFREVVKRLHGTFIVAGLGEWTEWQAAIDLFLKAAQAQGHLAKLASDRYEQILSLQGELADSKGETAVLTQRAERAEGELARAWKR